MLFDFFLREISCWLYDFVKDIRRNSKIFYVILDNLQSQKYDNGREEIVLGAAFNSKIML